MWVQALHYIVDHEQHSNGERYANVLGYLTLIRLYDVGPRYAKAWIDKPTVPVLTGVAT